MWGEIWHIIGPQITQVMSGGGATWHENALVPITRNGRREEVYWTYSYSPIDDGDAATGVGGVLVVCTETTQQVLSARHATEESRRFAELFEQAPSFMAMLRGPEHRFELANPSYLKLIGHRDILSRTVAEAIPEAAEQGYVELLDRVYRTGEPYAANGVRYAARLVAGGPLEEHYLDFVYQPIKDAAGTVTGVFVEGVDVTGRAIADAALRESERQLRLATDAAEIGLVGPRRRQRYAVLACAGQGDVWNLGGRSDFHGRFLRGLHPDDQGPPMPHLRPRWIRQSERYMTSNIGPSARKMGSSAG